MSSLVLKTSPHPVQVSVSLSCSICSRQRIWDGWRRCHIQCKACPCNPVMCSKMVALPLGISHTRYRLNKQSCDVYTYGVICDHRCWRHLLTPRRRLWVHHALSLYARGVEFGIVEDVVTSSAKHVHVQLSCVSRWRLCCWALATQGTLQRGHFFHKFDSFACLSRINTRLKTPLPISNT